MAAGDQTSRICVKNMPRHVNEEKIRSHFSKCGGEITDVRWLEKRRMGFLGFKTVEQAAKAVGYFHRTYFDTSKLDVQIALPRGSAQLKTLREQHPNKPKKPVKAIKGEQAVKANNVDEALSDFLSISKTSDRKFWGNDDAFAEDQGEETLNFDDDLSASEADSDDVFDPEATQDSNAHETQLQEQEAHEGVPAPLPDTDVTSTRRLFVRNLLFSVTENELESLFSTFGEIEHIHIPKDKLMRGKGFAFVKFSAADDAVRAMATLDGRIFQGRIMHVLPSRKEPEERDVGSDLKNKSSYQQQKETELRKGAGNDDIWNSLFLNQDAVMDVIASKYSVDKSDILHPSLDEDAKSGAAVAVRVALAETQVIQDTKEFLKENSIDVDRLRNKATPRSKTVLMAKNLPSITREQELRHLFGAFGDLGRVLLSPSRLFALIEMISSSDARKAFRGLAYKRFHTSPLYLEWAPSDVFKGDTTDQAPSVAQELVTELDMTASDKAATLFVKNINFATVDAKLKETFEDATGFREATIVRRQQGGETLSMGYGFIEFANSDLALAALKKYQGVSVDGSRMELSLSHRRDTTKEKTKGKKRVQAPDADLEKTKIIVKNLAFQATRKELYSLFGSFGQVKNIRIPKKFSNGSQSRGFAFVTFASEQEAEKAVDTLQDSHLYGRRLVLEWAKKDVDSADALVQEQSLKKQKTE